MTLPPLIINPPLLNSSSPWATTAEDLLALYNCSSTGAVSIRTSLLAAFKQHPSTHQYTFFNPSIGHSTTPIVPSKTGEGRADVSQLYGDTETSSLNTLGYSPVWLEEYLAILSSFNRSGKLSHLTPKKPFVVSVSGSAEDVALSYQLIFSTLSHESRWAEEIGKTSSLDLLMEINLSCPNIENKSPLAYSGPALQEYLKAIAKIRKDADRFEDVKKWIGDVHVHVGIKTPPYTYAEQFTTLVSALESVEPCPISFITSTNTLGSCLVLAPPSSSYSPSTPALGSVNGTGIGGMAGSALHPLSLGNVSTIRSLLNARKRPDIRNIQIIGIGGVSDANGWTRMRNVGASAVGIGTAFGRKGIDVFKKIEDGVVKEEGKDRFLWKEFGPRNC